MHECFVLTMTYCHYCRVVTLTFYWPLHLFPHTETADRIYHEFSLVIIPLLWLAMPVPCPPTSIGTTSYPNIFHNLLTLMHLFLLICAVGVTWASMISPSIALGLSRFSLNSVHWSWLCTDVINSMRRRMNVHVQPGLTTTAACGMWPNKDCKSLFSLPFWLTTL